MLSDIINDNRYPVVFVGSGMSKRYLKNFPNWLELLKGYWDKIHEPQNFFSYMRSIKQSTDFNGLSETEKEFLANTKTAAYIQEKFDNLFFNEEIQISNLSIEEAYRNSISPFKFDIANQFKNYEIKEDMKDEISFYVDFLKKAKVIVTTNYDPFIENLLSEAGASPNIFVGQNGFFEQTNDWAELYKIHGDTNTPESIVITDSDYRIYDNNSILISAKILVNMIESPIIFLGYSLSDRNVRKLLTDFASQLPHEDVRKTTNRIAIVDYDPNEHRINEEMMRDQDLDIGYLLLRTDNYKELYQKIAEINEGLSPHDVLRYQKAIRNIVVAAGSKGKLDTVLVSPDQMENLEEQIQEGKNIVVALGNRKNFFIYPDIVSYVHDYIFESNEFLPAVALSFVAQDGNRNTRTPFIRYLNENDPLSLGLDEQTIQKINNKIDQTPTLDTIIDSINLYSQKDHSSLSEILSCGYNQTKLINVIIYNIKSIEINELDSYIKTQAFPLFAQSVKNGTNIRSDLRKLFYSFDMIKNGEPQKIQKNLSSSHE